MEVTALLDGDGIRLLGKGFANLREVAVLVILIFHFTRVVDEGELSREIGENSLESLLGRVDHASGLNHLVNVGVLLSYWIVPADEGSADRKMLC